MEKNKDKVALVRITNDESETVEMVGGDVLMELTAWDRTMGHVAIEMMDDGTQYLIKWYPRGVNSDDKMYCDPVILAEGHIEDGDIQRLK